MTPARIVEVAAQEGLSFIALADHNEISNVQAAQAAACLTTLVVIPAVELSTPEGHLLVYFRDYDSLNAFYSKLDLAGRGTAESRCTTSMLQCLKLIDPKLGFAILAHVDGGNGLERKLPGGAPHKRDILAQPTLLGIELASATSDVSYSDDDPDSTRKDLGRHRIESLRLGKRQYLARVLFSDSHNLSHLGRNSQADRKVTRFKTQAPTFDGLMTALLFPDARVRIEDEVPPSVPYLEGVSITGGFLDGQHVRFNRNLTCIIGGRGTGKSTLLEAARSIASSASHSGLVNSDVWPDTLGVYWRDAANGLTTVRREKLRDPQNIDDPYGMTSFPVQCYSQNEISVQSDPVELLRFLDQFIDFGTALDDDLAARQELLENEKRIDELTRDVNQLPDHRRRLANTKQQFDTLAAAKGTEIIKLERQLAEERLLRQQVAARINEFLRDADINHEDALVGDLANHTSPDHLRVGADPWREILASTSALRDATAPLRQELRSSRKEFATSVKAQMRTWDAADARVRQEIQTKRTELEAQGLKLDMEYIRRLSLDLETLTSRVRDLEKKEELLKEALRARKKLVQHRVSCRDAIAAHRDGYAQVATRALRDTLGDLKLSIKFRRASLSTEAEDVIKQAMNWRTSQVPRAALIVRELSVLGLIDAVQTDNTTGLTSIKHGGDQVFTASDARAILTTLRQPEHLFRLHRCALEDFPQILVTAVPAGKTTPVTRDFSKLSLGQQQSVLLSLMLASNSTSPLIIDQPEDNLDSEFIYRSLVAALRRAKERRQVIIVTHNANIAVLGDAEQLIILKSANDRGAVVAAESIDDEKARNMACEVLEGTSEAFKRRMRIYGISSPP